MSKVTPIVYPNKKLNPSNGYYKDPLTAKWKKLGTPLEEIASLGPGRERLRSANRRSKKRCLRKRVMSNGQRRFPFSYRSAQEREDSRLMRTLLAQVRASEPQGLSATRL